MTSGGTPPRLGAGLGDGQRGGRRTWGSCPSLPSVCPAGLVPAVGVVSTPERTADGSRGGNPGSGWACPQPWSPPWNRAVCTVWSQLPLVTSFAPAVLLHPLNLRPKSHTVRPALLKCRPAAFSRFTGWAAQVQSVSELLSLPHLLISPLPETTSEYFPQTGSCNLWPFMSGFSAPAPVHVSGSSHG